MRPLATIRRTLDGLQRVLPKTDHGVAVLAYHLVDAGTDSVVDLPRSVFCEQMAFLRERCEVLPLEKALGARPQGATTRPVIALTFDDAYQNFRNIVWPILRQHDLPATLYVPVAFVAEGAVAPIRGTHLPPCSWSDLRSMVEEGLSIGSHSMSHRNLTRMPPEECEAELVHSREELENRLGVPVTTFCYPQAKSNRRVEDHAERHYGYAVAAGGRRVSRFDRRGKVPRFPVRRDLSGFDRMVTSSLWLSEAAADAVRQWIP